MKKRGIAYKRMIVSFAMIFVLPLTLVLAFYLYSYRVIERQIEVSNDNFVNTIQNACDRELQFYQNILIQLSMSEYVEDLADLDNLTSQDRVDVTDLMTSIYEIRTTIGLMGNECEDIFVYFPKLDMILSHREKGSTRLYTYAIGNYSDNNQKIADLKAYLSSYRKMGLISTEAAKMGGEKILITYCGKRQHNESRATLGIWLDMDELVDRIASAEWAHGYDWLILDGENRVVKGIGDRYAIGTEITMDMLLEDDGYMVYTAQSDVAQWTYVLMMPRELVESSAEKIQTFFALSIVVCILIAYFLIKKVTRLNYAPLESLMDALRIRNDTETSVNNEYEILGDQIKNLMHEKSSMESDISKSRKSLKQWGLVKLLVSPDDLQNQKQNHEWDELAKRFSAETNLVLIIREWAESEQEEQTYTTELKHFIVENIFIEGISAILPCTMVELDGRQILIANGADATNQLDRIKETICELQSVIYEKFRLSLTVTLGGYHGGLNGAHKSYLEARETEEFISILDQDFICYDEIKDKTTHRYNYSLQAEERISSAVQNNNIPLANALIHKVIDTSWSDDTISPNIRKLLLHDIFCTLLKTADEKGCMDRIYMLPKDLSSNAPVMEIKAHFAKVVDSICDSASAVTETSAEKELCGKVQEYISMNYDDPSLNISQTAFYFHLSPTTLSSIFKNETGKSLLMAINEFRIEKAMEYLQQGYSVADTAAKVGIPESSSFIRLFKKHMGITPGQVKNQFPEKK